MGCPTIKKAFEDSLNKSTLKTSDKFLIYDNGTIYNVTFGDISLQLGVTGALTGLNGGSATPVLTGTAPNYEIRGIVGGSGIKSSVNSQGSITLDAQFNNAGNSSKGEPLIPNVSAATILIRRLFAGNGINMITESDRVIIENSEVAASNNTVIVSDLSDFPTAVSGVITLADNTDYLLVNNISTSNRFVMGGNTVVRSVDPLICTLTYTGVGNMFTTVNGNQGIKELAISCPNGTFIDQTGNTTGAMSFRWLLFAEVKDFGTLAKPINGFYVVLVGSHTGAGWAYESGVTNRRLIMQNWTEQVTSGAGSVFMNLNAATFTSFQISNASFLSTLSGQTFLSGASAGANLAGDTVGYVEFANIQGDMAGLSTITTDDAGWVFNNCNKITETIPHALTALQAPAITTISTINTPVVIAGTFGDNKEQQFDINVNGRITYQGKIDKFRSIDATVTARPVSGTQTYTFYIAINGVVQTASGISREISSGAVGIVSLDWAETLQDNDFIEIYVENNTGTINCEVQKCVIRVA